MTEKICMSEETLRDKWEQSNVLYWITNLYPSKMILVVDSSNQYYQQWIPSFKGVLHKPIFSLNTSVPSHQLPKFLSNYLLISGNTKSPFMFLTSSSTGFFCAHQLQADQNEVVNSGGRKKTPIHQQDQAFKGEVSLKDFTFTFLKKTHVTCCLCETRENCSMWWLRTNRLWEFPVANPFHKAVMHQTNANWPRDAGGF